MDKRCLVGVGKKSQNPNAQVLGFGNLSVVVAGDTTPPIDTDAVYTFNVTNNPPAAIPAVLVVDIPADATFVSASDSGTYNAGTRKVTFPLTNIDSGDTFSPTVTMTFQEEQPYSIDGGVSTTSVQPVNADNDDSLSITAQPGTSDIDIIVYSPSVVLTSLTSIEQLIRADNLGGANQVELKTFVTPTFVNLGSDLYKIATLPPAYLASGQYIYGLFAIFNSSTAYLTSFDVPQYDGLGSITIEIGEA